MNMQIEVKGEKEDRNVGCKVPFRFFQKRNGMIVPFRREKIEEAVKNAARALQQRSGRATDDDMPVQVTNRVIAHMDDPADIYYVRPNDDGLRIPQIEDVQDLVEIVLAELGYADVAVLYKRYRKQREVARSQIRVRDQKEDGAPDVTDASLLLVESTSDNITLPWDRSLIVKQLLKETSLDEETALSVAKAVENQVIQSDLRILNSALIREFVNNELASRGLREQLRDLSIYRVPNKIVEQLMFTKSAENSNIVNNNPEAVNLGIAELVLKQWALDRIFSQDVKRAHDTGAIHLHDLGYPHRVYCSSHSVEYVKKYGLRGLINLNTESKPAKSASVLTGHLNTFLASMQANYAGALGLAYINILYAPYLVGASHKEMKQVAQELIFNGSQNAFSRGGQTLFLDFNIHSGVPRYLQQVPAIGPGGAYMLRRQDGSVIALREHITDAVDPAGNPLMELLIPEGQEDAGRVVLREIVNRQQRVVYDPAVEAQVADAGERVLRYGDFQQEARDFCVALLEVWKEGDRNGRVFEFPKCDFHVSRETFEDPEQYKIYLKACELASHNGSTYFIFDRDEVTLSACCRLRTTIDDDYMLRHPESMRFCGFQNVTINIPQAAYRASRKGEANLDGLFRELDQTIELAVAAHLQKRKMIEVMMSERGRPLYQIGKKACDGRPYVDLDTCTYIIGLIGVNDAVKFLTGEELHESEFAMDFGRRIVAHMYLKVKELGEKHKMKLTLEESPAESAARRLAKTDLIYFPKEARQVVKGDNDDVVYYTNSVHLAADAPVSLIKRIRLQSTFHAMIESGAITHAFVGEEQPDARVIAALMRDVFFRTQSAQVTISPEFTYCNACNHNTRGLHETCPSCGSHDVVGETRVVGYFSKVQNWNKSKRYGELVARHRGDYQLQTIKDELNVCEPVS